MAPPREAVWGLHSPTAGRGICWLQRPLCWALSWAMAFGDEQRLWVHSPTRPCSQGQLAQIVALSCHGCPERKTPEQRLREQRQWDEVFRADPARPSAGPDAGSLHAQGDSSPCWATCRRRQCRPDWVSETRSRASQGQSLARIWDVEPSPSLLPRVLEPGSGARCWSICFSGFDPDTAWPLSTARE